MIEAGSGDPPVGACLQCGSLPAEAGHDRNALDFVCGMCDPSWLLSSAGPASPGRPVRAYRRLRSRARLSAPGPAGGGATYASTADFERRRPHHRGAVR